MKKSQGILWCSARVFLLNAKERWELERSQMWLSISMPRDKGQKNVRNFQSASFLQQLPHPAGSTPPLSWLGMAAIFSRLGLACCPLH